MLKRVIESLPVRLVPALLVLVAAGLETWHAHGSTSTIDWLPWAVGLVALLGAVTLPTPIRPPRLGSVAACALVLLAALEALSAVWAPLPAAARDEALLVALYAACLAIPLVTLRDERDRAAVTLATAGTSGVLAVATALVLVTDPGRPDLLIGGRLAFPISYANAQGAIFLLGVWPAVLATADPRRSPWIRACSAGAAAAPLGGWLLTQSKGGLLGLVLSAVIVLAASPLRPRIAAVLIGLCLVLLPASVPLTEPFRHQTGDATAAIRHAGTALLLATVAAICLTRLLIVLEGRVAPAPSARRALSRVLLVIGAVAAVVAVVGALAAHHAVTAAGHHAWDSFRTPPAKESAATHFETLGSNRYDFWRVALKAAGDHPLRGAGARAFGPIYLRERATDESPARAHSLPLETLLEEGPLGLALLVVALGGGLLAALRLARVSPTGAAILGATSGWVAHTLVDWIWTFPAAGMIFFLLLGTGLSAGGPPVRRFARPVAVTAAAAAALAMGVTWLSASLTERALLAGDPAHLSLPRRLDPLSPEPLVAAAILEPSPERAARDLERAVARAPASSALRSLLAAALARTNRNADAIRQLQVAHTLDPRDPEIERQLRRAERG